jgi:hypothetical protein
MFLKIVRGQPGLHSETLFHKIVTIKSDKNLEALTFHSSPAPKDEELVACSSSSPTAHPEKSEEQGKTVRR